MFNYIEKLEFNIILNSIREYCTFFLSKNMALDIIPSSDLDEINSLQIETNEARRFLEPVSYTHLTLPTIYSV